MGNYRKAAEEENFFLRGFNYLFIMKKDSVPASREDNRRHPEKNNAAAPEKNTGKRKFYPPRKRT